MPIAEAAQRFDVVFATRFFIAFHGCDSPQTRQGERETPAIDQLALQRQALLEQGSRLGRLTLLEADEPEVVEHAGGAEAVAELARQREALREALASDRQLAAMLRDQSEVAEGGRHVVAEPEILE